MPRVQACVLALVLSACRANHELPPIPHDHPASDAAAEAPAPELRGTASSALKPAPAANAPARDPAMTEGTR